MLEPNGDLDGTTADGSGTSDAGLVFKIAANGKYTILHRFSDGEGDHPYAGLLVQGRTLVGTTFSGGDTACNCGTVFSLTPEGPFSVLYKFTGTPDGANPSSGAPLAHDAAGNLYGTTQFGGAFGCGTIYKMDASSNETVLYSFTCGDDGSQPTGVIRDVSGNLYGTTNIGGSGGNGTVFELTP